MTENKPIIIDGVDVSGCKKLDREYAPNYPEIGGYDWFNECKETSTDCQSRNCLFKQLARKTQECEELKKQLERKEANYQKLLNKSNKYIHNLVDENVKDISNLARQLNQPKSANEQAEQKLEQIRQILKNGVKIHDDIIVNKSILQIIDEVEW